MSAYTAYPNTSRISVFTQAERKQSKGSTIHTMNKPPISFILQFQSNEGADYFGPHINKQRNEWLGDESLFFYYF